MTEQGKLLNEALELLVKLSNKPLMLYVDELKEIAVKIHTAYHLPKENKTDIGCADCERHLDEKKEMVEEVLRLRKAIESIDGECGLKKEEDPLLIIGSIEHICSKTLEGPKEDPNQLTIVK